MSNNVFLESLSRASKVKTNKKSKNVINYIKFRYKIHQHISGSDLCISWHANIPYLCWPTFKI